MELPALKVGKPRPTPVVRGGITGIYICGYTPQTDCLSSDFDVVIILKKDMDKNDVEMLEERYPKAIKQVFNVDKTKLNDDYLKEMVQAIRKNRFFSAVEVESMEELAEIYYHVTAENRSQL